MNASSRVVAVAAVVGILSGCAANQASLPLDSVADVGTPVAASPIITLAAGWNVTGNVELLQVPGTSDLFVRAEVHGLTPGEHAWHIHGGSCDANESVLVPLGSSAGNPGGMNVTANSDGDATAIGRIPAAALTRAQIDAADYSVKIHNSSGAATGRAIACATI